MWRSHLCVLSVVFALVFVLSAVAFLRRIESRGTCAVLSGCRPAEDASYGRSTPLPQTLVVDLETHLTGVYNPSVLVPSGDPTSRLVLSVRSAPLYQADDSEVLVSRGELASMRRAALKPIAHFSGCMDARLFNHGGQVLAVACEVRVPNEPGDLTAEVHEEEGRDPCTRMCLLNLDTGQKAYLTCAGDSPSQSEKNWIPISTAGELYFVHTLSPFRLLRGTLPDSAAWPKEVPCVDVPVDPSLASKAPIASGWRGSSVAIPGPRGALLALVHRRLDPPPRSRCPRYEHAFAALDAAPPHAPLGVGPVFRLRGRDHAAQGPLSVPHRSRTCQFHYLNSVAWTRERVLFCVGLSDEDAAVVSAPPPAVMPLVPGESATTSGA